MEKQSQLLMVFLRKAVLSFTYPLLRTCKLNEKQITRGVSKGILEDLTEKFGQWRRCKRLLLKRIWKWFLDQSNWKKEKKEKSFLRWWNCTKITWGSKILLHCFLSLPTVVKYLRSTSSNSNKCYRLPNMI